MTNVRVVTDSAADLSPQVAEQQGIRVVPLTVRFGNESYVSGVQLSTEEFWQKIRTSPETPATAAPSPGDFEQVYRELVEEGATGIVSVHLSSKLSATYQSAILAAKEIGDVPIEVVDTRGVSAATGIPALRAAEEAGKGRAAEEIAEELRELCTRTRLYGVIDTLEYLRRGGRIGGAQALLGTMLKFKPVISVQDGIVEPAGRVRTRARALEHLADIVRRHADRIEKLVVVSGDAPDTTDLLRQLSGVVEVPPEDVWMLGPVVGAHAGPGVLGVVLVTTS